jgi:hypothetical protein
MYHCLILAPPFIWATNRHWANLKVFVGFEGNDEFPSPDSPSMGVHKETQGFPNTKQEW